MAELPRTETATHTPHLISVEAWQSIPWLRAAFSTRHGGDTVAYSSGICGEQNLGWTPEDDLRVVAENRRHFVAAVWSGETAFSSEAAPELVTMRQVHGATVRLVERSRGPLATTDGRAVLDADGLITREPGLVLGVQTADCVPILLADTRSRSVAAIHAGWRGTLAQIVEHGVQTMRAEFDSRPQDLIAAIGPSIGPCCFAVGTEVREHFLSRFPYAAKLFSEQRDATAAAQLYLNLWEANRQQLLQAGLHPNAISLIPECTACTRTADGRRKYFSHRAEHGRTGRMMSLIGIAAV